MKYIVDCRLEDFPAWSGAVDTLNELTDEELERLDEYMSSEAAWIETPEDTDINDFLWFETDTIAAVLGYDDWDSLVEAHKEEE